MNERILKLAEQATIQSVSENFTGSYSVSGSRYRGHGRSGEKLEITAPSKEWAVKFAELIVRECAEICLEMAAKCAGLPGAGALAQDCAHWIKKDFGVEE